VTASLLLTEALEIQHFLFLRLWGLVPQEMLFGYLNACAVEPFRMKDGLLWLPALAHG